MDQENFLAKWLEGTLSDQELQEFENTEEYQSYAKIVEQTDKLHAPDYNTFNEFIALKRKLPERKEAKVVKLDPVMIFFRIAAILILAFGVYYFFDQQDTNITTDFAENRTFNLPDNSEVSLNTNSSVTYNKNSWANRRALMLEGEAYFKVAKGETFDVITTNGVITVVGTQFNVKARENYFEVICYEGVVKVTHKNIEKTLTYGDSFKIFNNTMVEESNLSESLPSWIKDESAFRSIPLEFVLNELERQYEITIQGNNIDESVLFTGGFTHEDLDAALQSICIPLQIEYTIENDKTVKLNVK
ncbi:DUF4974 domain-containing protein [Flavobacteriaceae bacterium R38]|nr:DUF4974 domain-containing protein [Flavobacteriaceae bacterium R38]